MELEIYFYLIFLKFCPYVGSKSIFESHKSSVQIGNPLIDKKKYQSGLGGFFFFFLINFDKFVLKHMN